MSVALRLDFFHDQPALVIHFHGKGQTHARKDLLNLVERFAAKVLRFEHVRFTLGHQFPDVSDIGVLQTIIGPHGELQLFNGFIEVLVDPFQFFFLLFCFVKFRLFFEIDKNIQLIFDDLGSLGYRFLRGNTAIGPDFQIELVIVG